jgi:hypothetical protein
MRKLTLALIAAAALCGATAALADGPVITPAKRIVTTPIPFGTSCGSFDVLFTVDAEGTNISFYDDAGNLTRQIRHIAFTGTLYNSTDLSKSVPYDGTFTRTFDAATGAVTLTGLRFRVHPAGGDVVAIDAGQTVFDAVGGTISEHGPDFADFTAAVCSALA